MKFPLCFKKISRVLQTFLVWKLQGYVESIARVTQESFVGVSGVCFRVFEACSKGVFKQFQGSSRVFHESFKRVLRMLLK